jgi:membrane protease subunit HflK
VVIEPGQQGLLERFGRPVDTGVLDSGLHAKLPWPIDSVVRYDTRSLQSFNVGFVPDPAKEADRTLLWTRPHYREEFNLLVASREQQAAATPGDQTVPVNLLTVSIPVQYLIRDVKAWAYNHLNAGELIERIANREVVRYMASVDIDKIMSYGRLEASRDLQATIQKKADEARLGVEIVLVGLQDIHPPLGTKQVQVAAAYEAVIGAIANKEAKILEAEGYRAETLPKAAADAARMINEAHASALRRSALAAGHAAQFTNQLAAYVAAPTVFRARTYLDTFGKAVGPARKLVIGPTNTSDVIIFNLEDSIASGLLNGVKITDPDKK